MFSIVKLVVWELHWCSCMCLAVIAKQVYIFSVPQLRIGLNCNCNLESSCHCALFVFTTFLKRWLCTLKVVAIPPAGLLFTCLLFTSNPSVQFLSKLIWTLCSLYVVFIYLFFGVWLQQLTCQGYCWH